MPQSLIVIGGSGDIGRAICLKACLLHDIAVCVHYFKNKEIADKIVVELTNLNIKALSKFADLRNPDDVKNLFDECEIQLGQIKYLVNTFAIQGRKSNFIDIEYNDLVDVVHTNFLGAFIACQEAIRRMIKDKTANCSIVNISSQAALHGSPNEWIHYACSKAGIDTLTKGISKEVGKHKIRINAVRPGLIDTKIHSSGGAPDRLTSKLSEVSLGRVGNPDEVADLVYYLLSEKSSYITGSIIDINGGRL